MDAPPPDPDSETLAWQIEHIRQGLADLEAGRVIPHEEVVRRFAGWARRTDRARRWPPD
jgi:predicted transcriptional regulator